MGVTNRDASLTTRRRGEIALYAWRAANNYPANPPGPRREQTATSMNLGPSAEIPLKYKEGAQLIGQTNNGVCGCTQNFTYQGYDKKSPAC
jgi:hypothetical protein